LWVAAVVQTIEEKINVNVAAVLKAVRQREILRQAAVEMATERAGQATSTRRFNIM
jgi:hypothetical protein